ncbi:MAG TPA: dicarboxylate/amino acid:cation symporter [Spongiibacteraceae bacterium]|nr:dicarboxylate/amino acid:cation symporter [Spongiibacteraceae bacterium]HCS29682.1 dicarboxylate/amino acid:cation symporter [Spongiibacteraceae bacterium]|tara:strand:+ start:3100 stop:4359 length:1260 start_codon:yes stop_codon:yes gene_type:complete
MKKVALHWQIAIAIALAIIAGTLTGTDASLFGVRYHAAYGFLGTLFLNALKMIIVPLVTASIISGIANIGDEKGLGTLGGKTLLFYFSSSLLAILVGLTMVNIMQPGVGSNLADALSGDQSVAEVLTKVEGKSTADVVEVFIRMVPPNIIAAAAEGQMLGLIFFSLLFGYFLSRSRSKQTEVVRDFWNGIMDIMTLITLWVMKFAPLGVFGLVAKTVSETGFASFQPVLIFFITVILALGIHSLVTMPLLLRFLGGISPAKHYRAMSPALLTAFSTASSSATLPLTMECLEEAGVSQRVRGFVLPLGATVNMDGTALYECVAAIFIAQAFGFDLSFTQQFTIVVVALLTSIGVAGIPAASLVAISIILGVIGIPLEGIGLLMITDRVLDMMRTAVNVFSDSCATAIIARSEGEQTKLAV